MQRLAALFRRHILWAAFAAAMVPLLILLALQFAWLSRLRRVSEIAQAASLGDALQAVGAEVESFYRTTAERALDLPADLFVDGRLHEVAALWSKRPVVGASRLFLVDFTREQFGHFLVYNPERKGLEVPPASDESLALIAACTPYQVLRYRGQPAGPAGLRVDERDPDHRIILNPILDEHSGVVGIAGMIVDEAGFWQRLLPAAAARTMPQFFPDAPASDLVLTARDASGRLRLCTAEREPDQEGREMATTVVPFVFTDVTLGLRSLGSSPAQWARAGFAFNVTLSVLLAAVLTGGIVLALRAANRAMLLSQMKADFVSNVSHELRTPLASIRVFAELLRLGRVGEPERVREYGGYIEGESRRLGRLIENILDFARIESGRKTYLPAPTDLRDVVAGTLRTFETRSRHSGFEIVFEPVSGPMPLVPVDPDAIAQAVNNLVDNAVKYSGDSRTVRVRLLLQGEEAVIAVQDHGIGIARSEQHRIFERFHRVGTGLVHDIKGSGLGLSIVSHIVRAHGGRVSVDSEPGRGSTFAIHLPARGPSAEPFEAGAPGFASPPAGS